MKSSKKTWHTLKDNKCPNCKEELLHGMFDKEYSACQNCGFTIKDDTKKLIVDRDHTEI